MSSQPWPDPTPDADLVSHLTLGVRRVSESTVWQWQLIDEREGSVFESGLPYESAMDARAAGLARLAELAPSLPGATAGARTAHTPSPGHVIVVSRNQRVLYGILARVFGESESIDVIEDRRRSWSVDRQASERRAPLIEVEAKGPGWWMVRRSDGRSSSRRREGSV
jgi:hypothetical protein